jgi:hypothetical protein
VTVLIDADMIVTRSLDPLLEAASKGQVVAFENDRSRFVAEWGEILGLGEARPGPYVSSGLVMLGGPLGSQVLNLMHDCQRQVDIGLTVFGRNVPDYPFLYPEQDVLNAILRTRVEPYRLVAIENRLGANLPFAGLRLVDGDRVRCAYPDGSEPYVLHHFDRKPWLTPVRTNVYSRLLTRLLLASDVPLRLDPAELPLRLRSGAPAGAARIASDLLLTPAGLARRLRDRRARVTGGPNSSSP